MTHVPPLQALRSARAVPLAPARRPSVALVGGGPTTLYALQVLSEHDVPFDIHVFEKDGHVGPGMPYREGINHPQMLANIGGRELPPLLEPLHDWLTRCDAEALQAIASAVSSRGARVSACAIGAILEHTQRLGTRAAVAVDGSVFTKYTAFQARMEACLRDMYGADAALIELLPSADGSGIGAAVIAATA